MTILIEYNEKDFESLKYKEKVFNAFIANCKNTKIDEIIIHVNGAKPFLMKHHKVTVKKIKFKSEDYKIKYTKLKPHQIYQSKEVKKKEVKKEVKKSNSNSNSKKIVRHSSKRITL